jgi:hypothetical protein
MTKIITLTDEQAQVILDLIDAELRIHTERRAKVLENILEVIK